jgi:hypothetical protein
MYTFKKVDKEELQYGTSRLLNLNAFGSGGVEDMAQFHSRCVSLFGKPLWVSDDVEDAFGYIIIAEDENCKQWVLTVYNGASGPAIGGDSTQEDIMKAAYALENEIEQAPMADCSYSGIYADAGMRIIYAVKNGVVTCEERPRKRKPDPVFEIDSWDLTEDEKKELSSIICDTRRCMWTAQILLGLIVMDFTVPKKGITKVTKRFLKGKIIKKNHPGEAFTAEWEFGKGLIDAWIRKTMYFENAKGQRVDNLWKKDGKGSKSSVNAAIYQFKMNIFGDGNSPYDPKTRALAACFQKKKRSLEEEGINIHYCPEVIYIYIKKALEFLGLKRKYGIEHVHMVDVSMYDEFF